MFMNSDTLSYSSW